MKRNFLLIILLIAGLNVSGCATGKIATLEYENRVLRSQIEGLDNQLSTMNAQVYSLQIVQEKNKSILKVLEQKILKWEAEAAFKSKTVKPPESKPAEPVEPPESKPPEQKTNIVNIKTPKVKILCGDGNMSYTKKVAGELSEMGCEVKRIGRSRSNFSRNTVYYTPEFHDKARELVEHLGDKTIFKPLTWSSAFDIIVVTASQGQ